MAERLHWLPDFLVQLRNENILVQEVPEQSLPPAHLIAVDKEDWGHIAQQAAQAGLRWCALWAEHRDGELQLTVCLEKSGGYLLIRTPVELATPLVASCTPHYPAADRPERHVQDMFGIAFMDHPDPRRWIRHQAWPDSDFPLRKTFPAAGHPTALTPPNTEYPFLQAQGAGVYEIPVGPIHAGVIEPGHFRFQAVGETVLNLEERLGYVHKGIEKIAEGRDPGGLARLAGRVSGDTTVGHAWAACMAMERAAGVEVPSRALALRALMAERERIANHLGDVGAICGDVGFAFAQYQFSRLRELCLRLNVELFGHRLMMDRVVPGGVSADLTSDGAQRLLEQGTALRQELNELGTILDDNASLQDRLCTTGVLAAETARALGVLGYVARASGLDFDLRRDAPYAPYDTLQVRVPVLTEGDVAARLQVRLEEILAALDLIEQLLGALPAGSHIAPWRASAPDAEGLGLVESWRGELLAYVRFGAGNLIARYYPRDPSVLNWPALEKLIHDNIVPDFPVCNKSVNGSYSGHDL